jgi:hypothetical protein
MAVYATWQLDHECDAPDVVEMLDAAIRSGSVSAAVQWGELVMAKNEPR